MGVKIICEAECKFNRGGLCRFNNINIDKWHECLDYQPIKDEEEPISSLTDLGF